MMPVLSRRQKPELGIRVSCRNYPQRRNRAERIPEMAGPMNSNPDRGVRRTTVEKPLNDIQNTVAGPIN